MRSSLMEGPTSFGRVYCGASVGAEVPFLWVCLEGPGHAVATRRPNRRAAYRVPGAADLVLFACLRADSCQWRVGERELNAAAVGLASSALLCERQRRSRGTRLSRNAREPLLLWTLRKNCPAARQDAFSCRLGVPTRCPSDDTRVFVALSHGPDAALVLQLERASPPGRPPLPSPQPAL